jgi:polyisoprenoid-binding protein YceI
MIHTLLALTLAAPAGGALVVDPGASVAKFHLHHKMHAVDGSSSQIEGKAVIAEDGKVMTMIRIPVTSFATGDSNRDSHMRETLEASKYPFVVFKGVTSVTVPVAHGKPLQTSIQGELEFHGVKQPITLPAQVAFEEGGGAVVRSKFPVSLDAHKIERPSLLFIKVDDNVDLEIELKLKGGPR